MITKEVQKDVLQWLADSDSCESSQTIAFWLGFGIKKEDAPFPHDPTDFRRCLTLLDTVPELRPHLFRMAKVSPTWKDIVGEWESIESMLMQEVELSSNEPIKAPKTHALLKRAVSA